MRAELVARARRIRDDIQQIFVDARSWNINVRLPGEEPIDPDPTGELERYLRALVSMLELA